MDERIRPRDGNDPHVLKLPGSWSSYSHKHTRIGKTFSSLEFSEGHLHAVPCAQFAPRNDWPYSKPSPSPSVFDKCFKLTATFFASLREISHIGQPSELVSQDDQISQGLEKNPLVTVPAIMQCLPPEIWLLIVEAMPPETASAFASACRYTYLRFASACRTRLALRENHRARAEFLNYWDKLRPRHRFCHFCLTWHLRSINEEWDFKVRSFMCPLGVPLFIELPEFVRLDWAKVQLVMRASRLSPSYGIPFKRLCGFYGQSPRTWLHQVCARVIRGRLLLRVESLLHTTNKDLAWFKELRKMPLWPMECLHDRFNDTLEMCACAIRHLFQSEASGNRRPCGFCHPVRRCHECPTEYLVRAWLKRDMPAEPQAHDFFRSDDPEALILVISRWKDLGEGISPFSREWTALTTCSKTYDEYHASGPYDVGELGGICERFEESLYTRFLPQEVLPSVPHPQ